MTLIPKSAALCALLLATAAAPAMAAPAAPGQTISAAAAPSRSINVPKDKSVAFRLDRPAGELVVAQPDIAEIVATTDLSFYIRGKTLGSTNILVYDPSKRLIEMIDVRVGADAAALRNDLSASLPGETIEVRNLADGFLLTGQVSTPSAAARAVSLAERYAPKAVTSSLTVRDSQQVMLEVRIIEASRSALQDFGIDISAISNNVTFSSGTGIIGPSAARGTLGISGTIGKTSVDVTLQALEEKGVIRTLAKPNLVAVSGETAEFLAGGEFPYPIPVDQNTVAIEFRPFGVKLKFLPTVQENGLIRMKVEPEVSQLDPRQSLRINGFDLPGLTVRRASTTIDLRDSQSFAVAGLFQQDYANTVRDVPGLSDIPILGALFRSAKWRRMETELVIIVTPHLGGAADATLPNPLADTREPTTIDLILDGLALDRPIAQPVGGPPASPANPT
jgi:pilus assembly protein CpaC